MNDHQVTLLSEISSYISVVDISKLIIEYSVFDQILVCRNCDYNLGHRKFDVEASFCDKTTPLSFYKNGKLKNKLPCYITSEYNDFVRQSLHYNFNSYELKIFKKDIHSLILEVTKNKGKKNNKITEKDITDKTLYIINSAERQLRKDERHKLNMKNEDILYKISKLKYRMMHFPDEVKEEEEEAERKRKDKESKKEEKKKATLLKKEIKDRDIREKRINKLAAKREKMKKREKEIKNNTS
jgi:hypothetical protein